MLENARVATKLVFMISLLAGGLLAVAVVSERHSQRAEAALARMAGTDLELVSDFSALYAAGLQTGQGTRNVLLNPSDEKGKANFEKARAGFDEVLQRALHVAPEAMRERLARVQRLSAEDGELQREVMRLAQAGRQAEAVELLAKKETPKWREVRSVLVELLEEQRQAFGATNRETIQEVRRGSRLLLVLLTVTCAVTILLSLLLSRSIRRTIEKVVARSHEMADAVARGDLSVRGDAHGVPSEFRPCVEAMNATMDAFVTPVRVTAASLDRLASNEIPPQIEGDYRGDFGAIKDSVNRCIAAIALLDADADTLAAGVAQGKLSTRIDVERHRGAFRKVTEAVNAAIQAFALPVAELRGVLQRIAERDLTARMEGAYRGDLQEMKESLNRAVASLHDALAQVTQAVEQVSGAAGLIASSSDAVASGASEQASSLQETTSSLESVSSTIRRAAGSAHQAAGLASTAKGAAAQGSAAVEEMAGVMAKVRASAQGTSEIIKDINAIAFQTNLLALNAAVEAARAGEAGRGFAVVAEEVRSLALRAKEAATRTEELIRESMRQAGDGERAASEVSAQLSEIVGSVSKVTDVVAEIAAAAKEQASGIDQIGKAMTQMNAVTQQNAASSEQSSSAAAELSGQSAALASMVGTFRLEGAARAATATSRSRPAAVTGTRTERGTRRTARGAPRPA